MQLRVGAATDTGRVRTLNEDVYMVRPDRGLFVVCDGMGGAPAGEVASQIAAETILEQLDAEAQTSALSSAQRNGFLPQTSRLADAVRRSNDVIYSRALSDPTRTGMGTTIVGAWIHQHVASLAHVGDSRAYLWHDNELRPLTRDHSLGEEYARAGVTDIDGSLDARERNILVRVLGREPEVDIDLSEVPVQSGDYLLLCTDGLTRMLSEPMLCQAIFQLRDPQRICDHLVDSANGNGGADNITVVVVELTGGWWWRLSRRWEKSIAISARPARPAS